MLNPKKEHPKEKSELHPRNKHRERYDFKLLIDSNSELAKFVKLNDYGDESIDFSNPEAVIMLNKSLLKHYYGIDYWQIPNNYLCPPIPGRADYIHYLADLLAGSNNGRIPKGLNIRCLDIGIGANCIYPIIGNIEYAWSFVGSDIDPISIESASKIILSNPVLQNKIELRHQPDSNNIFKGIIQKDEIFDISICNPPFHSSLAEAQTGSLRKLNNLNNKKTSKPILNFGGKYNELCSDGGEEKFISDMIVQSKLFSASCLWFTSLVSK